MSPIIKLEPYQKNPKRKLLAKIKNNITTTGGYNKEKSKWRGSYSITLPTKELREKGLRPGDLVVIEVYDKE